MREKLPKDGSRAGSINEDGNFECRYRAPNGCCAAGTFIPDDKYDPSFENQPITDLYPYVRDIIPLEVGPMKRLQITHDNTPDGESAVERCVNFVEKNVEDKE